MSDPTPVTVTSPMRRTSYNDDMFADLVRPDVRITARVPGKPCWSLTFLGTEPGPALSDAEKAAVVARMDSTDDTNQARRAALRACRDALVEGDTMRLVIDYVLEMP